ncbi:MAG: VWA domain-containing protein [Verrucomicrobiota bacterium]
MLESLYFANPWGALALLGIPVVLAIHFFQQPARPQLISTLFLWQRESPESLRGSAWDRLRSSWPLWLQLLMVLLLVWLLLEPRWVQQWSRLNVIFVLDSSASMDAFRKETISTVDRLSRQFDNTANDVNWMLMPTHVSGGDGYHGEERIELMAVLNQWQPTEGRHDFLPALERGLMTQGRHGLLIFITDHDYVVPAGVSTYAVGRPLSNVGFTGARCFESDGTWKWEVLVRNFGDAEVERDWWVELNGEQGPVATLNLAAGQSGLLTGFFPEGVQKISMALAQDELQLDNRFPLVIPQQARIRLAVKTGGKTGQFINRLTEALPYVRLASTDDQVDLVTLVSPFGFRSEDAPAEVVFRSKDKPLNKVVTLPVLV